MDKAEMLRLAERLEKLLAKATPGPWGIWFEQIDGKADRAIQEFVEQVHATNPIGNSLVMLDADGKCPAITGCGPTSIANASLIVEAVNALPVLLSALRSQAEELERLRRALRDVGVAWDSAPTVAGLLDGRAAKWFFDTLAPAMIAARKALNEQAARAALGER